MSYTSIKTDQRFQREISLIVDGTGTAAVLEGTALVALVDNGTGDYTLTFGTAFSRTPVVLVGSLTSAKVARVTAVSASAVTVKGFNIADGTTAADIVFHAKITGWDTAATHSENS